MGRSVQTVVCFFGVWLGALSLVWGASPPHPATRPAKTKTHQKHKAKSNTKISAKDTKKARKTGPKGRNTAPASQPTSKKAKATKKTKKKGKKYILCKGKKVYGKYCLGRVIGALVEHRSIRCPLKGETIKVIVLKSLNSRKRDSDLRVHHGKNFMHRDYIWMCPQSGYAAYPRDFRRPFDKRKMLSALRPLKKWLKLAKSEKIIPGWLRYQAAAASYWARGKKPRFFGRLFLRAMWAAREEKARAAERRFRFRAIAAMSLALKKKVYPLKKQPTIAYLIAELFRQAGKWKKATAWFEQAFVLLEKAKKKYKRKGGAIERMIITGKQRADKRDKKIYLLP
ncbi:MAG TPA: hypothetical protein DCE42_13615 [Myxococcales bacterium]|nr:hypothetical protein [Deltaproteobacteria bacterium]HAA55794.1 hypothetical protein [Myxococcales bacterium]|tara:strand:- start:36720 stop:37739 length:1020 start_codon:yes stop_codon:yes gene_type:complete